MNIASFLPRLRRDDRGSMAIEFALLGPVMIAMVLGVLQVGIGMQSYNALRGISGDVSRYAVVNYQTSNRLQNSQIEAYARSTASGPPYGLDRDQFGVVVEPATVQRVTGATELTLTLTYRVPSLLTIIGVGEIPLNFQRPIFVTN